MSVHDTLIIQGQLQDMQRFSMFLCVAAGLVAACDSETASFPGIAPVRVTVDDRDFDVYSDGRTAQAIRMSFDVDVSRERARLRSMLAIRQVTGCEIETDSVGGDQVIVTVDLDC
ncbi:hypothetical protein [Pontivivens insulae]|nr:hypothetical protein [Pontivivens insulae]